MSDENVDADAPSDEQVTKEVVALEEQQETQPVAAVAAEPSADDAAAATPSGDETIDQASVASQSHGRRPGDRLQRNLTLAVLLLIVGAFVLLVIAISNHEPAEGLRAPRQGPMASAVSLESSTSRPDRAIADLTASSER